MGTEITQPTNFEDKIVASLLISLFYLIKRGGSEREGGKEIIEEGRPMVATKGTLRPLDD